MQKVVFSKENENKDQKIQEFIDTIKVVQRELEFQKQMTEEYEENVKNLKQNKKVEKKKSDKQQGTKSENKFKEEGI